MKPIFCDYHCGLSIIYVANTSHSEFTTVANTIFILGKALKSKMGVGIREVPREHLAPTPGQRAPLVTSRPNIILSSNCQYDSTCQPM